MRRVSRDAPSYRRLLEAAAVELVSGNGRIEVAPVAARAGTSVGLIYRNFGSKAGMIAAVVEDFYDRYDMQVFDAPLAGLPGWAARERVRLEQTVDFYLDDPLAAVILGRLGSEPEVASVEATRLRRHADEAAANVRRGQERGEIPKDVDPGIAGAMILGGLRQALAEVLTRKRRPSRARLTDELWRFVAAGVRFQQRS
jgi:AcrR family transcriptional regulator